MLYKTTRYEHDTDILLEWANRPATIEERRLADTPPPEPYRTWVENILPEDHRVYIKWWVGQSDENSPGTAEWQDGFPHIHVESVSWVPTVTTSITYIEVPEEGGELAVGGLSPDDPYELIKPEVGLTVIIDAQTWHGVKPIIKGSRTALITSGFPEITHVTSEEYNGPYKKVDK